MKNKKLKLSHYKPFKKHKRTKIIALIVVFSLVGISLLYYFSAFAVAPKTGNATFKVLDIGDNNEDVSDEADVWVYEKKIANLDISEVRDLEFDDFDTIIEDKHAEDVKFFMSADYLYKVRVVYKGSERWYTPEPGENIIMMIEKTNTATLIMRDDENWNETYYGNSQLDYDLEFICADDDEGLMPSFLFNKDDVNLIWICFNFSRSAQESFAKIDSYHNEKIVNGTQLYIGVTGMVVEKTTYFVTFGVGKVSTYDLYNIGWFFGLESEIIPIWNS
ncbi:MAG: hypothetical protein ACFE96_14535 [Candidatus Hermodarchaeota archaeon]